MEKNKFSLIIIFVSVFIILVSLYFFVNRPLMIKTIEVNFIVSKDAGIDLGEGELSFGRLRFGDSVARNVIIENNYDFPIRVDILVSNNLKDFLFSESEYYFEIGEEIYISFNLVVPKGVELMDYEGEVRFEIYKG